MPVSIEDWIKNPNSIINNIFENDPENFDSKLEEFFKTKLMSEKDYQSIPCVNEVPVHELTPNCLVRYRCMIQDSFDPVYFTNVQTVKNKSTGELKKVCLKYKEAIDLPIGYEVCEENVATKTDKLINHNNLLQRTTFFCVPIPGESKWVKEMYKAKSCYVSGTVNESRSDKRSLENDDAMETNQCKQIQKMEQDFTIVSQEKDTDYTISKVCYKTQKFNPDEKTETVTYTKKTKNEKITENNTNIHLNLFNNFPLNKNENGSACLVKIYDDSDKYKINDLVEFIGIFNQDPSLAYQQDEHRTDSLEVEHDLKTQEFKIHKEKKVEDENHHLYKCTEMDITITKVTEHSKKYILSEYPPSLVPRIHCITSFNLLSNNPLIRRDSKLEYNEEMQIDQGEKSCDYWTLEYKQFLRNLLKESNKNIDNIDDSILFDQSQIYLNKLRNEIILMFQELLLGDSLAAEYLLMYLLSSVFMRKDVTILGKFCLNITNIPSTDKNESSKSFVDCFYSAISKIVSMSHLFQLSIDNMNNSNLIPNKDYTKDKLISGMLQLPELFHLVIDETVLNAGELKQKGLINLNSLKDIIKWQKINYDFGFHQHEFNTNLRILILSETKSIITSDVQLKLSHELRKFESESYEKVINKFFDENKLNLINYIRKYFSILAHIDYKLSNSMQQLVENDIVQLRQNHLIKNKEKMSFEDFHTLLVVARLQTISYGKNELTIPEWNRAKSLEIERLKYRV